MEKPVLRQGDVLLVKRNDLPKGMKNLEKKARVVLAHGEVTGHAHAIYEPDLIEAYGHPENAPEQDTPTFIEVKKPVYIQHEEHTKAPVSPGFYEVIRQRAYDSFTGVMEIVKD